MTNKLYKYPTTNRQESKHLRELGSTLEKVLKDLDVIRQDIDNIEHNYSVIVRDLHERIQKLENQKPRET